MGLFGGFRAKFTRNSKSKETTKEIVCLKYLVHSEFDPVNTSNGFVPIRPALRKNSFTPPDKKQKRVQVKSQIIENHAEPSQQIKKSKSFNNIVDLPPPPPKTPPPDITTERKLLDDTFKTVTRPITPIATNPVLKIDNVESDSNSNYYTTPPDYYTSYDEPSTLILMTQHSSEPSPSFRIVEEQQFSFVNGSTAQHSSEPSPSVQIVEEEIFSYVRGSGAQHGSEPSPSVKIVDEGFDFVKGSRAQHSSEPSPSVKFVEEDGFDFVKGNTAQHSSERSPSFKIVEDEGFSFMEGNTETNHYVEFPLEASDASTLDADDFHVNIMEYSDKKRYSMSEDEVSNDDIMEDHQEDFMEYSSQASSIFFGNDMQPVPARRRMITLQDDDGNNRRIGEEDGEC